MFGPCWPEVGAVWTGRPFFIEGRDDFWLPQLCCSAMRAKAKRLPRPSGIVWTMVKTQKKQKAESISPLMSATLPPWRTSFFWRKPTMPPRQAGNIKRPMMYCAIRYDNPSIRGRSHRRRRTVSAMSWLCAGRKGGTLLSLPRIPTSSTSIVTSITTLPPLTVPGNSETSGAPVSPSGGSPTDCALKTGCLL